MSDERTISDETICTNCGKPRCEHYDDCGDDYIYCFKDTNGDFFTTEPTPEMEMEAEIERLRNLNNRALAIITGAIMHGMPVTEEVAAVRNEIVGIKNGKDQ